MCYTPCIVIGLFLDLMLSFINMFVITVLLTHYFDYNTSRIFGIWRTSSTSCSLSKFSWLFWCAWILESASILMIVFFFACFHLAPSFNFHYFFPFFFFLVYLFSFSSLSPVIFFFFFFFSSIFLREVSRNREWKSEQVLICVPSWVICVTLGTASLSSGFLFPFL